MERVLSLTQMVVLEIMLERLLVIMIILREL